MKKLAPLFTGLLVALLFAQPARALQIALEATLDGAQAGTPSTGTGSASLLLDDVTNFARRRPIVFLAAAVGAGFMVGRLARAGRAIQQDGTAAASAPTGLSTSPAMELPAPVPVLDAPLVTVP